MAQKFVGIAEEVSVKLAPRAFPGLPMRRLVHSCQFRGTLPRRGKKCRVFPKHRICARFVGETENGVSESHVLGTCEEGREQMSTILVRPARCMKNSAELHKCLVILSGKETDQM